MSKKNNVYDYKSDAPAVYVVGGNRTVINMFDEQCYTIAQTPNEADILCFTGGPDINPFLYGQMRHASTGISYARDMEDIRVLRESHPDQILVGICRGAQFLNVMVGNGSLYQDVDNHTTTHRAVILDPDYAKIFKDDTIKVTSTHHQMMIPGARGEVILGARLASHFYSEMKHPIKKSNLTDRADPDYILDTEAVLYSDRNTFCYQPHPEYKTDDDICRDFFFTVIEQEFLTEEQVAARYTLYYSK